MQITPSVTTIQRLVKIQRRRTLAAAGEVVARVGQEVSPVQIVARTRLETGFHVISASDILQVPATAVVEYLLVEPGQTVQQGTPILRKKRLVGQSEITSPIDGTLYDVKNGRVILQRPPKWLELRAMMRGRVVNYFSNRGVTIETDGAIVQGVWDSGKDGYGNLKLLTDSNEAVLTMERLGRDTPGLILVAGKIHHRQVLEAADDIGVNGIVAGSMSAELCVLAEKLNFPIVLTEGIGSQPMLPPIFEMLTEFAGEEASLFAGSVRDQRLRPEIIIPQRTNVATELFDARRSLSVGQRVRIWQWPNESQIGSVARLYAGSYTTSLGIRLQGADISLSDGTTRFVPLANLDVIA